MCICDVGADSIATAEASVVVAGGAETVLGRPDHSSFSILFVAQSVQMDTSIVEVKSRMIIQFNFEGFVLSAVRGCI